MKIGRNAPCPCGSGKKYKNCCINEDISFEQEENKNTNSYPYLTVAATTSLVKSFAGLTLLPQNHGKYARLKLLSVLAFLHQHHGSKPVNAADLGSFLNKNFAKEKMEDEPMCSFTDLVTFDGGDHIIFPGIEDIAAKVLSNLIAGIYHWEPATLPDAFKANVYHISRLVLAISNELAKRLGYSRYMEGTATDDLIFVPADQSLEQLQKAVTFTRNEMDNILVKNKVNPQALQALLINTTKINQQWLPLETNNFINNPIYFNGTDYIILHPPSLAKTVIDYIWNYAKTNHCTAEVARIYHDLTWNNAKENLRIIGFQPIADSDLLVDKTHRHSLFSIDVDKLAYVSYLGDQRDDRPPTIEQQQQRWQQVTQRLQSSPEHAAKEVLVINVFSSNGRLFRAPVVHVPNARSLNTPVFDLDILADLQTISALHLWKYAGEAYKLYSPLVPVFSFIDGLKFYREQDDSFSTLDSRIPIFPPGYSFDWKLAALHKADRHSLVRNHNGDLQLVQLARMDKYAPIYVSQMELAHGQLIFAVDIGAVPVWVGPDPVSELAKRNLKTVYWLFSDGIAYWVWQLGQDIAARLIDTGMPAIRIGFRLDDPAKFATINQHFTRPANLEGHFKVLITGEGFQITIPHQILLYLYGADNEGERILVKQILHGFNLLLKHNGKELFSADIITTIINRAAPLGPKKKLFIMDSSHNLLMDPSNLKEPRNVQLHDVSHVDNLINIARLPDLNYKGVISDKADKSKIISGVVHKLLLPLLIEKLSKLDCESLLKRLLGLNESLIKTREEIYLTRPTRIACYVSVEQHQQDIARQINENSRTTVATRCLIEHIAAERYQGTTVISDTAIDELIAIMDRIIFWGGTKDQIYYDLLDTNVEVLENGVIDIVDDEALATFLRYHQQKTKENIVDASREFKEAFPLDHDREGRDIPAALDKAYLQDVGVTFTRICDFLDRMTDVGFRQSTDYAVWPLSQLQSLVNDIDTGTPAFEAAEFNAALHFLALRERGDIIKLPGKGYDLTDISPWRYNRILSLLRSPLVITGNQGQEMVYWGPRQCLRSKVTTADQMVSDRFKALPTQKNIKAALGRFAKERGDRLVDAIDKGLKRDAPANVLIRQEQFISPSGIMRYHTDIGDVDELVIDPNVKMIYSVESKAISPSRSIKEMVEEVDKLLNEKDGWVKKHMTRHEWLKANLSQVSEVYKIDVTDYQVKSIFVTEENMLTPHLKHVGLPLPFLTRYDIEATGYSILKICK